MSVNVNAQDVHAAVSVFGAKAKIFASMTLADAQAFMDDIEAALAIGDMGSAGRAGHALKSITKQVGASSLAALAESMQYQGEAGKLQDCAGIYEKMKPLYAQLKEILESI